MTDKQIIIDGVDVSGCEYYNKINKHTGQYCICELEPNCLYKQVKRKEQECEELKGKVKLYEEILQRNAQGFETGAHASTFSKMVNDIANLIRDKKLFKLKQTLTEIKEIAKNGCYDDCGMPLDELSIVLQKISECEVVW